MFPFQTALLLVVLVVPTLHIVRAGIDENIAFLLLGFGIVLSDDRMEVVKIVTFYTWLLEGMCDYFFDLNSIYECKLILFLFSSVLFVSVLPLCHDPVLFGQSHHAHEVHDTSQVSAVKLLKNLFLKAESAVVVFWPLGGSATSYKHNIDILSLIDCI